MIARLRGRPVANTPEGLVIDVGGVGYVVAATPSAVRKADGAAEVALHTYLHVREDALQLYGFATSEERELFELLLGVSGVGPKVALAILSGSSPAELRRAIARDDVKRFQAIPGVGLKTMEPGSSFSAGGAEVPGGLCLMISSRSTGFSAVVT